MSNKVSDFTFFVLAYNHEKYIIEHLESIKYLILKFGQNIRFQLIVSDDASSDETTSLVDFWLEENGCFFFNVVKRYNVSNIGTCSSLKNGLDYLQTEYCKITGGDDVYSFVDLFKSVSLYGSSDILSGIPLSLVRDELKVSPSDVFNMIGSDVINKGSDLIERFKGVNLINTPNIIYKVEYLKNKQILDFVSGFDVVEDLPLQVAIAEFNQSAEYFLDDEVFVYYRRTLGSTYLVASDRFTKDQLGIFTHLLKNETSFFNKIILKNRRFCFLSHSKLIKRLFNLARFIYVIKLIMKLPSILRRVRSFEIQLQKHQRHIKEIQASSSSMYSKYSFKGKN